MNSFSKKQNVSLILLVLILLAAIAPAGANRAFKQADDEEMEYGITGKTEEPVGAQPWMVALVEDGYDASESQFCGGTLIAPQWVLTAAHCIEDTVASEMDVVIGRHELSSNQGERIDVDRLVPHPQYSEFHDIALIHLVRPATAGQVIDLVTAVNEQLDDAPATAHMSGWGIIPERGDEFSPDGLHGVDIPIVTQSQCRAAYGEDIDGTVLCAGLEQGGADSCSGDSGGPLVVPNGGGWALAGVVSWGDGCGLPGKYGVYTRVASYDAWIAGYLNGDGSGDEVTVSPSEGADDEEWFGEETAVNDNFWDGWLDDFFSDWYSDDDTDWDDDEFVDDDVDWDDEFAADDTDWYDDETAVNGAQIYSLGAYDGSLASMAADEVDGEIITVDGVEMLLEDWSDEYGPYFIGLLNVDGELLEIHSEISSDAVMDAAQELLR